MVEVGFGRGLGVGCRSGFTGVFVGVVAHSVVLNHACTGIL